MKEMKFGNWQVSDQGIEWMGKNSYCIEVSRLTERGSGDRSEMYDWLVHMTEKTWISRNDLHELNCALVYSIGASNQKFDLQVFVNSVIEQDRLLKKNGK